MCIGVFTVCSAQKARTLGVSLQAFLKYEGGGLVSKFSSISMPRSPATEKWFSHSDAEGCMDPEADAVY